MLKWLVNKIGKVKADLYLILMIKPVYLSSILVNKLDIFLMMILLVIL